MSLLINNPVKSRLEKETECQWQPQEGRTRKSEFSLVQHQQGPGQTRDGCALEDDGNQENGGSGGEVKQNQGQHELPVHRDLRHEADQAVYDATE